MSGFWAAGPGWASWVIVGCLFALGLLLGGWWGWGRGWDHAVEDARRRRAQAAARRTSLIDYRPPEVAHEEAISLVSRFLDPQVAHEAWLAYEEQTLTLANETLGEEWDRIHPGWRDQAPALVRPDLTDSAYIQDMGERMDRFLAELCGVPYSADELWSGQ